MKHEDRERILTLQKATLGMNPNGNVSILVKDLNLLTSAALSQSSHTTDKPKATVIDGGFTTEASKE